MKRLSHCELGNEDVARLYRKSQKGTPDLYEEDAFILHVRTIAGLHLTEGATQAGPRGFIVGCRSRIQCLSSMDENSVHPPHETLYRKDPSPRRGNPLV